MNMKYEELLFLVLLCDIAIYDRLVGFGQMYCFIANWAGWLMMIWVDSFRYVNLKYLG